ncbi:MAG: FG-GAP-like repeat-containing protein, partial [Planctomycetota bacterium]
DLDLAVTNANDDTVSILINQGDGSFDVISSVAVGDAPSAVVTADFNADMKTDLAVTNEGDDNVVILFGDGAGNFTLNGGGGSTALIGFSTGDGPLSMLSDDFDNDDDVDLTGPSMPWA